VATCATVQHAKAMPVSVAEPVRSSTANATAIGARYIPKYEIARADSSRKKLRPTALLPVALQSRIGLPERHRTRVALVHIPPDSPGELLFCYTLERDPLLESESELGEMARDVVRDAEVDECKPRGSAALELVDRLQPGVRVELRRRGRRQHLAVRLDANACCIPGVQRPVGRQVADVMARVAGSREADEIQHALADDADVCLRHRGQLAPQVVERIAVEPARARLQPARVEGMRRADRRHVHLERRVLAHQDAGGAGMVEVDVREQQVTDVLEREPARAQPVLQRLDACGRAAVEERGPVLGLQHVRTDDAFGAEVVEIEGTRGHVSPDPCSESYGRKWRTIASRIDTTCR